MLKEKLHIFGVLGCVLCVVGSTSIVLHAPKERDIESVTQVWGLATEPGNLANTCQMFFKLVRSVYFFYISQIHYIYEIDITSSVKFIPLI